MRLMSRRAVFFSYFLKIGGIKKKITLKKCFFLKALVLRLVFRNGYECNMRGRGEANFSVGDKNKKKINQWLNIGRQKRF